jgi:hypothetical protein
MIRKYTEEKANDLAPGERVAEANATVTLRYDGQKLNIIKGRKYIIDENCPYFEPEKPKATKKQVEKEIETTEVDE